MGRMQKSTAVSVLLLLLSAADNPPRAHFQEMTGTTFQRFALIADKVCLSRNLRDLDPSGLVELEEEFEIRLSPQSRKRLTSLDKRWEGCPIAGASCPGQHTLQALEKLNLLGPFTMFACSSGQ
ncbi:hypothetical protein ACUXST_002529 [Sphingomonas sp. F9_3S_D5_B_2]